MLTVCPNCKKAFKIGDEIVGHCPTCEIKLIFKGKNEIIERVNIERIEKEVDDILGERKKLTLPEKIVINGLNIEEDILSVEKKIDDL